MILEPKSDLFMEETMSFYTTNELTTFDFSQSAVISMRLKGNEFLITVSDVIISEKNSQNQELRSMGTDEMTIKFMDINEFQFVLDGYTLYNMDDTVSEKREDKLLDREKYEPLMKELCGCPIYQIEKKGGDYCIYIDTDEQKESYTVRITASQDKEEWERFRNLPAEYR